MPFLYPFGDSINLEGKTVILPIVSTANVAQLAVDLLIASLSLKRIAMGDPAYFIPVVGGRENGERGITTPLELFGTEGSDIVVFQQRSPVLKSRKQDYVDGLIAFLKQSRCGAAIFLSGMDLTNRTDAQMFTPTYQYRPQSGPPLASTPLQALTTLPIPTYSTPGAETNGIPVIPGGGLTRRILASVPPQWTIPTASLLQFVLEGDNRADSHLFATVLAKIVNVDVKTWKEPESWGGLFGSPHDQSLYG